MLSLWPPLDGVSQLFGIDNLLKYHLSVDFQKSESKVRATADAIHSWCGSGD